MMLDLTDDETQALISLLKRAIADDPIRWRRVSVPCGQSSTGSSRSSRCDRRSRPRWLLGKG
jgi:hypothetical protein